MNEEIPCRDTDPQELTMSSASHQGPLAFTVDLGGNTVDKKLALKDGIQHFAPSKKLSASAVSKPNEPLNNNNMEKNLILDPENNVNIAPPKETDQQSDTGTYTIDDDEEEEEEENGVVCERKKVEEEFILERPKPENKHEWVRQWASNSAEPENCTPFGSESPTSSTDREESARLRRKLPATPETGKTTSDTENYLQDTITVMAAMEARIDKTPVRRKPSKNSAEAIQAREREERKIAWERRKNYDPLKAIGKKLPSSDNPSSTPRSPRLPDINGADVETCSDTTCSDIDPFSGGNPKDNRASPAANSLLPSTRPNRAFALRQKLNTSSEKKSSPKHSINSNSSKINNNNNNENNAGFPRSDGGRFSLRGTRTNAMSTSLGPAKKLIHKKAIAETSTRSTSSLSSKEAEFQAWKRRKNYNPLASAAAKQHNAGRKSPQVKSNVGVPERGAILPSLGGRTVVAGGAGGGGLNSARFNGSVSVNEPPMQRAASFHYPDGFSRVQHNVYSSEDESPVDDFSSMRSWDQSELYELNEDEFILPIGRGPDRSIRSKTASSRSSQGRMEALDNLVISTIYSISTKLCLNSAALIRRAQENSTNGDQVSIMDTLLYVLEDTDPPASPSKKTSRELAGTLRNLKKVEQALQSLEVACFDTFEEDECYDDETESTNK